MKGKFHRELVSYLTSQNDYQLKDRLQQEPVSRPSAYSRTLSFEYTWFTKTTRCCFFFCVIFKFSVYLRRGKDNKCLVRNDNNKKVPQDVPVGAVILYDNAQWPSVPTRFTFVILTIVRRSSRFVVSSIITTAIRSWSHRALCAVYSACACLLACFPWSLARARSRSL